MLPNLSLDNQKFVAHKNNQSKTSIVPTYMNFLVSSQNVVEMILLVKKRITTFLLTCMCHFTDLVSQQSKRNLLA
jgi:hypothetical protein